MWGVIKSKVKSQKSKVKSQRYFQINIFPGLTQIVGLITTSRVWCAVLTLQLESMRKSYLSFAFP
ncbi:MAG: hypothetical protein F6J93_07305 [Oscillatoria sp. SIO1A7]|nr:hypothetical protein [Oscillatoria sp. SIO1A7]